MVITGTKPTGRLSERNSPQLKSDFSFSNGSTKHGQQGKTLGGMSSGDEMASVRFMQEREINRGKKGKDF
jgi:hypothetical protein